MAATALVPAEYVVRAILVLRGQRVLIDADLAELYGVPTRVLNQAVRRNRARFPADFMFRLNAREKSEVITNCDHLARLRFSSTLPLAFTEHGALMAATVLNSPVAIGMSLQIVRAFVRMREIVATHRDLARKLDSLEKKYDVQFRVVFDAIRRLMDLDAKPKRRIGFSG